MVETNQRVATPNQNADKTAEALFDFFAPSAKTAADPQPAGSQQNPQMDSLMELLLESPAKESGAQNNKAIDDIMAAFDKKEEPVTTNVVAEKEDN